jgi:Trk K+ transport system NAD-binding subunit
MYVIVVGGGNTGSQLAKFLIEAKHTVRVIDERPIVLEKRPPFLKRLGSIRHRYSRQ